MSNNHILLGLGGTGGGVILAFRKILWTEHRNLEPRFWDEQQQRWSSPTANIGFLYIDSSDKELNRSDALWDYLGQSLALAKNEKLLIRDANMEAALQNLQQSPGISGWLGDPETLQGMIQNSRGSEGANQIRRFGRYLFAQSARRFEDRIKEVVNRMTTGNESKMTFHVCCTLGCGTGSGSLVDAISQIRCAFPDSKTHRIFLYVLVTDEHVPENVGFFYPNQYAALCELNALRQGSWKPHDVLAFSQQRLEGLRDNFQSCFLISAVNEKGEKASKEEQQEMIAGYIYQKAVALKDAMPRCLHQAESFEDYTAHSSLLQDRCTTFGSFGLKRMRIPEEEIREKLSFTFSSQVAIQCLFNNWSEHGFVRSPLNRDLPELVTKPENNERWYLTDEHLKVSRDFVLAGGHDWPSIGDEWRLVLDGKKQALIRLKNGGTRERDLWLPDMLTFADAIFEKGFRDRGVQSYYRDKREAILDYAREIRRRVEIDLFERWRLGEDSVSDTERLIDVLMTQLQNRKQSFEGQISQARADEKKAEQSLAESDLTWRSKGIFTERFTNKSVQILSAYTAALVDKYVALTEAEACGFALELVKHVISQLGETRTCVSRVLGMFTKLADDFDKEVKSRIRREEAVNYEKKEVRLVEPKEIDSTIRAMQVDPEVQKGQCSAARAAMAAALGASAEEQTFSSLVKKVNEDILRRIIFRSSDKEGLTAHSALFKGPTELRRILGRNVVEKLHEDHGTVTDALRQSITTMVQRAAAYMSFDGQQTQPSVLTQRQMPAMPRRAIAVFLPKAPGLEEFRESLKQAFIGAYEEDVQVVDTENKPNEILLVSVSFWFEIRFVRPLAGLRRHYEDILRSGETQAVHQIHLENHRTAVRGLARGPNILELARLELPAGDEQNEQIFVYLLLSHAIGYLLAEANDRGVRSLHYAQRDPDGMALTDLHDLGTLDFTEASKRLPRNIFEIIRKDIDSELGNNYVHVDKKGLLLAKLDSLKKSKFEECGRQNSNPIFRSFAAKVEESKNLVNGV